MFAFLGWCTQENRQDRRRLFREGGWTGDREGRKNSPPRRFIGASREGKDGQRKDLHTRVGSETDSSETDSSVSGRYAIPHPNPVSLLVCSRSTQKHADAALAPVLCAKYSRLF